MAQYDDLKSYVNRPPSMLEAAIKQAIKNELAIWKSKKDNNQSQSRSK